MRPAQRRGHGGPTVQRFLTAAVETALAAGTGSALAWTGYELDRRILAATLTFQGGHSFVDDLVVDPWLLLVVLVGVPVLAVLTTLVALARIQAGPLEARPHARTAPPSAGRALPLALGVGGPLVAVALRGFVDIRATDDMAPVFVVLTMLGLVAIGPWLAALAGRAGVGVSRRAPGLIAARRMAGDPRATFRAVSGGALAAFAVSYSASLVGPATDRPYDGGAGVLRPGVVEVSTGHVPAAQIAPLLSDRAVATRSDVGGDGELVESCAELARMVVLSCSTSALPEGLGLRAGLAHSDLPIARVYIATDGTPAAENRVRTQAPTLVPNAIIHTQGDRTDTDAVYFGNLAQLLHAVWLFVLLVAMILSTMTLPLLDSATRHDAVRYE